MIIWKRVRLALIAVLALAVTSNESSAQPLAFSGPATFSVGLNPVSVVVGDFNGDGRQDLAVANAGSNTVSILLAIGGGAFLLPNNVPAGAVPSGMAAGDFNNDGKLD